MSYLLLLVLLAAPASASESFPELLRNGLLALQGNDLARAETNLSSAAKLEPQNARVWIALARTYWKQNEPGKAEQAARKASGLAAGDRVVLQSLAVYYADSAQPLLERQQFAEVVSLLDALPPAVLRDAQLQLTLGVADYGLRRFDDAAAAFLTAIDLAPSVKQPYVFLGKMLDQIPSHLDQAAARFLALEKNSPADYQGYLLHAKVLNMRAAEPETARKLLDKVIAMEPRNADAHFELGSLLDRSQHFAEAAIEFERAASLNPSDASTHYRLSRLYQRLNKPEAATAEREQHRKMVMAQNAAR